MCVWHSSTPAGVLGSLNTAAGSVTVGPPAADAELQLTAILNPLTREAQRFSQVRMVAGQAGSLAGGGRFTRLSVVDFMDEWCLLCCCVHPSSDGTTASLCLHS